MQKSIQINQNFPFCILILCAMPSTPPPLSPGGVKSMSLLFFYCECIWYTLRALPLHILLDIIRRDGIATSKKKRITSKAYRDALGREWKIWERGKGRRQEGKEFLQQYSKTNLQCINWAGSCLSNWIKLWHAEKDDITGTECFHWLNIWLT